MILLTGGAGYIGSHTAVALLNAGYEIVIVDNYINSSPIVINRIETITNKKVIAYKLNVCDKESLLTIMNNHQFEAVIHFAGLKAVGESVVNPLVYYRNNLDSALSVLECMKEYGIKNFIFSSSATVYGEENPIPFYENMPRGNCSNPYGWTKYMIEQILMDEAKINQNFSAILLRYFNPIGAHESGLIGEDPLGIPNNLMPFVSQVAIGKLSKLTVFGNDYPTPDGTCRRDYIHVMDLAEAHLKALEYIINNPDCKCEIFNIGTGIPYSVMDVIDSFEKATGHKIPYEYGNRRLGDIPDCYANVDKAHEILKWEAHRTLLDMCKDSWNWQKKNPNGYIINSK